MTRAVTLAEIAEGDILNIDGTNNRIGIGTTNPQALLQVGTGVSVYGNSGIVSATKYYGSGANLTGITAGATLSAGSGAQRVVVTSLTSGTMTSAATDAELTYNSGTNTLSATTFSGALTGNASGSSGSCTGNSATATVATNAQGLTGTPDITVRNIIGVGATLSGVLTYEDVTNIDSVGIVTARSGLRIVGGGATVAGIATFHDGADIEGFKVEDGQTAATPNGEFNFYLASGHFFRYTGTPGADYFPNFKHSASINLNDRMDVNDVISATLVVNSPAVTYHIANTIHIDGNSTGQNSYTIDTDWVGGTAPAAGNGSGHDIYSFTIIKTADKNFTILANALGAA
jgi:hypothetical protein